jgi:hypothetical protein
MLRGAGRQAVIQAELDLRRRAPLQRQGGQRLALERIDDRVIPQQQLDGEPGPGAHERAQEFAKCLRQVVAGLSVLADEAHAGVDVPADDVDRALGVAQGAPEGAEIAGAIDEHGGALGPFDAPGIAAGLQNRPLLRTWVQAGNADRGVATA